MVKKSSPRKKEAPPKGADATKKVGSFYKLFTSTYPKTMDAMAEID